eukprot:INCI10169.2.p1 GENE.INCI10169.2~~INCI10169.2.p1  ORF type:complete len:244 (+),score=40.79 INCI10169.2:229-960(+)
MTSVVVRSKKMANRNGEGAIVKEGVRNRAIDRQGAGDSAAVDNSSAAAVAGAAPPRAPGAEAFAAYLDPESRLNRVVDGMAQLDVANTTATGTHEGTSGGRVFKVSRNRNIHADRETPTDAKQSIVPKHTVEDVEDMEQYNYTQPEDVDYYMSDTDSEIGELTLAELLERDIEELKYDMEETLPTAGAADQAKMRAFLAGSLSTNPAQALDNDNDSEAEVRRFLLHRTSAFAPNRQFVIVMNG